MATVELSGVSVAGLETCIEVPSYKLALDLGTPELQRTECLVIEASFLDELVTTAEARAMGHVHLDELIARAELLPSADVVVCHFSARYAAHDVRRILEQKLPERLRPLVRPLLGHLNPRAKEP